MDRRAFLHLASSYALIHSWTDLHTASDLRSRDGSKRRVLFITVDGLGPEYLRHSDVPNLKRMMQSGAYVVGRCVIPSVTNVNNASIVTASLPKDHGITGNYYYDRAAAKEYYMESADFLLRPTIFEQAKAYGMKSALVTSKYKLLSLLARGADIAVSAENPTRELVEAIGPQEDIYLAAANYWSFRAARYLLRSDRVNLLYLATTDYMMHTYSPEHPRSQEHMHTLDKLLAEIMNDHSNLELYLTADHGMSPKTEVVDIRRLLASKGIESEVVPIIKDKHVVHHSNLGGSCYVYLKEKGHLQKAMDLLRKVPGVEDVYGNQDAAQEFNLRADRIGDIFLLGQQQVTFGNLEKTRQQVSLRSHGSRHEQRVPILCYGRRINPQQYQMNLDVTRNFVWGD